MTEYLTKWPEAKPIPNKNAETIAQHFHEEMICRHGCTKELLSDQGTEFCNQINDSIKHYANPWPKSLMKEMKTGIY